MRFFFIEGETPDHNEEMGMGSDIQVWCAGRIGAEKRGSTGQVHGSLVIQKSYPTWTSLSRTNDWRRFPISARYWTQGCKLANQVLHHQVTVHPYLFCKQRWDFRCFPMSHFHSQYSFLNIFIIFLCMYVHMYTCLWMPLETRRECRIPWRKSCKYI